MLSLDPQINYSVFAAISVRIHEVFSNYGPKCIVYTLYNLVPRAFCGFFYNFFICREK